MSAIALGPQLPWSADDRADRRFSGILFGILLPILLLSLLMPLLPLFELPEDEQEDDLPPRLAELVIEQQEEPPPPPPPEPVQQEEPPPEPVPEPEPEPVPEPEPQPQPEPEVAEPAPQPRARESGVMAFADQLQDVRNNQATQSVRSQRDLSAGAAANTNTRRLITNNLGEGSTGIQSQVGSPGELGGGTELAGRSTTRVEGPPGGGQAVGGGSGRSGGGGQAVRSIESIQVVFDRNKSSLFSIYQRGLRTNPGMRGTVVLKLEIQPSGEVSSVSIVSSDLNNPELENKILNRVRLINFGAQDGVPVWRGNYPIRFFPS